MIFHIVCFAEKSALRILLPNNDFFPESLDKPRAFVI